MDLSYEAHVESEPLPGRPAPHFPTEASPASYGSQIGAGIETAGAVLQNVHDKVQAQARQTQLTDFHNQAQGFTGKLLTDPDTGALAKQDKNAFGLSGQYLPQFDAKMQELINAVPDPRARLAAQQSAAQMRNHFSEQLDSHELQQHQQFADKTDLASVSLAQQAGPANYNHADILASNLDTIGVSLQNMGTRKGWSQEQIDQAKQEAVSHFHANVIDRIVADGKLPYAQHYLDTTKDSMDATAAWSAQRTIDAQSREIQNGQKQDIVDRYQDSLQAAQFGLKNPSSVTRAELDLAYPKDAQRKWDGLQMMAAAGAQARQYDQMTPQQIQDDVQKNTPTHGGPEATFAIKGYEMRARAAQQSLSARNADPAQFAIDSGAGWKPIDITKPQDAIAQLKSRANSQGLVSEQTGVNTPLLSKQETKQFTGWLDNQKPTDRLQVLAALRATLPSDQAYGALMKQVAPMSPITAVAGSMLDKPPANASPWFDTKFATDPVVPQRMLEGEQILRAKDEKGITSKFPMPADKDLQTQFTSAVGGSSSDLFRGRPETLETAYAAYKAYYAAEANHQGKSSGVLDSDIAQRAAAAVVGRVTTYGNTTLVVPPGMDPTHFEGTVNAASKSALMAGGYSDKDIQALRGYGLRELGDTLGTGRYVIIDGNGDPLKSKTGENTVLLDLNKMRTQHASSVAPEVDHEVTTGGGRLTVGDRR